MLLERSPLDHMNSCLYFLLADDLFEGADSFFRRYGAFGHQQGFDVILTEPQQMEFLHSGI